MSVDSAVLDPQTPHHEAPGHGRDPVESASAAVPVLLKTAVIGGVVLTVLVAAGMAARVVPVGSRAGNYSYRYVRSFSPDILWPFVIAAAVVIGALWLSRRTHRRFEWATVAGWLLLAVPLQLLLRTYDEVSLSGLVASNRANGFLAPAQQLTAGQFLRAHGDIAADLPTHARTNMPGKTLLYHLLNAFTDSAQAMGVMIIAVSSISALLIYLIARDLLHDPRTALYALALAVLVPGKLYFLPILNVVSPVPILLALWLLVRFLHRPHWAYAAAVGAVLYLTVLFEPLPLAMGLIFAALLGWAVATKLLTWPAALRLIAVTAAALAACHVGMHMVFGYDTIANFAYVFADAHSFNGNGHRPYQVWVVRNLWDFTLCAGLAATVAIAAGTLAALRQPRNSPIAALALSGVGVLVFLDLFGVNRGETVRLWIFLAVFLQLTAAWLCARTAKLWPVAVLVTGTALQAAVGMAMVGFVRV
ncbi:hypothetical protein [Catellatospora sichuanensis]|uniref:hypothetical protein n=1 Tax=Catellatospora sichuanensis TaxID=1969805 RepID=UPI001183468D|nr:hypothetical protein [Catellatospora sichuanensis]